LLPYRLVKKRVGDSILPSALPLRLLLQNISVVLSQDYALLEPPLGGGRLLLDCCELYLRAKHLLMSLAGGQVLRRLELGGPLFDAGLSDAPLVAGCKARLLLLEALLALLDLELQHVAELHLVVLGQDLLQWHCLLQGEGSGCHVLE